MRSQPSCGQPQGTRAWPSRSNPGNFYWPAKAFPLWIEQRGEEVVAEETSYIMPFGPQRRMVPPEWSSITLAVQLVKPGSKRRPALDSAMTVHCRAEP